MSMRKFLLPGALALAAGGIAIGGYVLSNRAGPDADLETVAGGASREPRLPAVTPVPRRTADAPAETVADPIPDRPQAAAPEALPPTQDDRPERPRWARLGQTPMTAEEWESRYDEMQKRRADFMSRFDADGDGRISDAEREVIRAEMQARRMEDMLRRMTPRFDTDGDGVLNDAERLAAETELEAMRIEREARFLERYDTDRDGVLSDAERQAAGPAGEWGRGRGPGGGGGRGGPEGMWEQALQRYDTDLDGELNLDESYEAYLEQFNAREQRIFVRTFDANGDGSVGPTDLEAYLLRFNDKDAQTDINNDGALDQRDVEMFRDYMIKAANADTTVPMFGPPPGMGPGPDGPRGNPPGTPQQRP